LFVNKAGIDKVIKVVMVVNVIKVLKVVFYNICNGLNESVCNSSNVRVY